MEKLKQVKLSSQDTLMKKRTIDNLDDYEDHQFWDKQVSSETSLKTEKIVQPEKKRKKIRIKRDTDDQILQEVKKEAKLDDGKEPSRSTKSESEVKDRKSDVIVDNDYDSWKPFEIKAAMAHVQTSKARVTPRNGKE